MIIEKSYVFTSNLREGDFTVRADRVNGKELEAWHRMMSMSRDEVDKITLIKMTRQLFGFGLKESLFVVEDAISGEV